MIASGTIPLRPMTLQSPQGTYGTIPAPTGGGSTPQMAAPQFYAKPGQLTVTPNTVLPGAPPRMAPPAPTSPSAPLSPPPAVGGAPRPATPANVNPSLAGTSTISPAPGGFNPQVINADPSVPRGNSLGPPPAAPAPAGIVPPGTTAVSGGEVPYHIGTDPNANTTGVLSKLATEAGRQLDQPTVYDDAMAKQIKDSQVAGVNNNYDIAQQHLDASLADRGINYSTIAGGDIMDLNKQRAGELSTIDANIAKQRSADLAAGRSAAFNNASSYVGTQTGVDQTTRGNQIGERGYADTLRNQAQAGAIAGDQSFQQLLSSAYGQGTGSQAGAAGIYGTQGAAASGAQATDQQGLAELAQLAAQFFGQKAA